MIDKDTLLTMVETPEGEKALFDLLVSGECPSSFGLTEKPKDGCYLESCEKCWINAIRRNDSVQRKKT